MQDTCTAHVMSKIIVFIDFRGYYMVDSELYHIEPQAALVTGRHLIYRESDSLLPVGKCGKPNVCFYKLTYLLRHLLI